MRKGTLLLFFLGMSVHGEVFLRQPAGLPQRWQRTYAAPFRLQNSRGELEVFHSTDSLNLIYGALQDQHGGNLAWVTGEVMAWAMSIEDGWLYRYLVQPLPEGGYWITSYRQPLRSAGTPGDMPTRHRLRDLPVLPQSSPTFYRFNEENRLCVEISETVSGPDSALETLSRMIVAEGWTPSPLNTGGFQTFLKGNEVAFIGAQRGKDGKTRILRLHKPLGVK
ncbi:MAG: hypothetical protein ACO3NW_06340 [Kiritimatiellia bacterium]